MTLSIQIDPIKHEKVQDKIYAFLRYRIMSGFLEPGQPLKLIELAEAFGTSAMPVREALNRLVAEHALANEPNRSVLVPVLTRERLNDLRKVRKAIETLAVREAIAQIADADIARLRGMLDEQQALCGQGKIEESVEANSKFHFEIYRLAGSEILIPIIESLWLQFGPYLHYARQEFEAPQTGALLHHHRLVEALAARDADAAAAALCDDVDLSFDIAVEAVNQRHEGKTRRRSRLSI